MRLDPKHAHKLATAIETLPNGSPEVKFDIGYMDSAMDRLTPWEQGLLTKALMRAARSRRRSVEQRALLALFVHQEAANG